MGIQFTNDEFNKLMEGANAGRISPYSIGKDDILPSMWTYPDEDITWVGTVDVGLAIFGAAESKYGSFDVFVGVSPYRLVCFTHNINPLPLKAKAACRSYWFKIDFEGHTWTRGKLRKKEYVALEFAQPILNKGVVSQTIKIMNLAKRNTGKQDKILGDFDSCQLEKIQWYDPQAKKRVGRHAAEFHAQIIEAYQQQVTVTASELVYLFEGPDELDKYLSQSQPAAGSVVHPPQPAAGKVVQEPKPAEAPVKSEDEEKQPAPKVKKPAEPEVPASIKVEEKSPPKKEEKAIQPEGKTEALTPQVDAVICPKCGHENRPGTKFCGSCGSNLEKPEQAEIIAENPVELLCNNCQKPLEPTWKACPYCGEELPLTCAECGQLLEDGWKLCPVCGAAV